MGGCLFCYPEQSEGSRFFAALRMTESKGLRMTEGHLPNDLNIG